MMSEKRLLLLNGPNLNMLGTREPEHYGSHTLAMVEDDCTALATSLGFRIDCLQSNHEGELVTAIQNAVKTHDVIILNAGAYTHTSIALRDALSLFDGIAIEVHLSNVYAREPFRHKSMIAPVVNGVVAGFGAQSYLSAIHAASGLLQQQTKS